MLFIFCANRIYVNAAALIKFLHFQSGVYPRTATGASAPCHRKCRRTFQGALYLTGSVEEHSKVPFTLPEVQESVMISMFIPTESQVFLSPSPVKKTPNKYRCLVDVLCVRDRELVVTSENVEKLDKQALM